MESSWNFWLDYILRCSCFPQVLCDNSHRCLLTFSCIVSLFWMNLYSTSPHDDLIEFLVIIWISFPLQDNAIFCDLWSLRGSPGLDALNFLLKCMLVLSLSFCVERTKHWKRLIHCFVSNYFQFFACDREFLPFHLWWFMKGYVSVIVCRSLLISLWFSTNVIAYCKQLSLVFFGSNVAFLFLIYSRKYKNICDTFHDLVPFVPFKKREKHPWRSVTFSKVAG